MVKQLVILGDSFCHGVGTVTPFKNIENTNHAFGKYIADHLNLEYVNLAEPGISILKTIEIGYQYLKENHSHVEQVVIGWTNPGRLGIYSEQSAMQILPNYICLGDTSDEDVFVKEENNVKFFTNKFNEKNLDILPKLHRIMVENDFFNQDSSSQIYIDLFRTWLTNNNIKYKDFSVFATVSNVMLPVSFLQVMKPNRHPTKEEQQRFAELLLQHIQ